MSQPNTVLYRWRNEVTKCHELLHGFTHAVLLLILSQAKIILIVIYYIEVASKMVLKKWKWPCLIAMGLPTQHPALKELR